MQFTTADKAQHIQININKKLKQLKKDINSAESSHKLQKCWTQFQKIKNCVSQITNQKIKRELKTMIQFCQSLINQKTKSFKKQDLQKISNQSHKDSQLQKQKILKYSKSADNFKIIHQNTQVLRKKIIHKDKEQKLHQVQAQIQNSQQLQAECLRSTLTFYKNKMAKLQNSLHPFSIHNQKQDFEENIKLKFKQRGYSIQQLKDKLKYFENANKQLRNRVLEEERSHMDYFSNLKTHISCLTQQIQELKKDKRKLKEEVFKLSQKNQQLQIQIDHLMQTLLQLQKEKRTVHPSLFKINSGICEELAIMSEQEKYIREMEVMIQRQKQANVKLKDQIATLKRNEYCLLERTRTNEKQQEKLVNTLDIKNAEIQSIKKELFFTTELNYRAEQELLLTKVNTIKLRQEIERFKTIKESEYRKKIQHLKQVKQMISQNNGVH